MEKLNRKSLFKASETKHVQGPSHPFTRDMSAPHVKASQAIIAMAAESPIPATLSIESVFSTVLDVLTDLVDYDTSLEVPRGQLKLWGSSRFEDDYMNLDDLLNNKDIDGPFLKECLLRKLVEVLLHEDRICDNTFDKLQPSSHEICQELKERIKDVLEEPGLATVVRREVQCMYEIPSNGPEISKIIARLFEYSPLIVRIRRIQALHLQRKTRNEEELADAARYPGLDISLLSLDTPVPMTFRRLDAIGEILRKRDVNTATKETLAKDYLSEFGRERDRLERFYHARSKGKVEDVAQNIVAIEKRQSSLINALVAFIKKDSEKPDHPVQASSSKLSKPSIGAEKSSASTSSKKDKNYDAERVAAKAQEEKEAMEQENKDLESLIRQMRDAANHFSTAKPPLWYLDSDTSRASPRIMAEK